MAVSGGSVWGRVLDRTGSPVAQGVIHWLDPRPGDGPVLPRIRFFPCATTDETGAFWASDLPPGPCILVPDREDLCVGAEEGRWEHGTRLALPVPREPEVVLRFPHMPADFSRLRGTLSLPDTRPARDWTVELLHPDRPQPILTVKTNVEGEFQTGRVPPGEYVVRICGSAELAEAVSTVTLRGGRIGTLQGALTARSGGARFRGRVVCRDGSGVPLEGVLGRVFCPGTNPVLVRSGADGVALAAGLPAAPSHAVGEKAGLFPGGGGFAAADGGVPEALLTLRTSHVVRVEVADAATGELVPRYNVHLHHEAGMAGDECGPRPRGVRGRGGMDHGRLVAIAGPCRIQVEAPGYAGADFELVIPPEGLPGPVKVELRGRG